MSLAAAQGRKRWRDRETAATAFAHVGSILGVEVDEEEAAVPGVEGHVPRQSVRGCSTQQEAHAAVEGVRVRPGGLGRGRSGRGGG